MFITFGNRQGSSAGSAFLFFGTLCTAFGFAILVAPNLLAYFVASLLIIMGISLLWTGWKSPATGRAGSLRRAPGRG